MKLTLPPHAQRGLIRSQDLQVWSGYFVVFLVFSVLSSAIYFGQAGELSDGVVTFSNPFKPSYVYFLTYGFTFLLLLFLSRSLPKLGGGVMMSMILFGLMHLAWLPFIGNDPTVMRTLVLRTNVVVLAICFQIILSMVQDFRSILYAIRIVVLLTTALNVLIIMAPQLFTVQMGAMYGRASGLYNNPNLCATLLAMMLPLATYGKALHGRFFYYIIILIGVFFTFSRGGLIIWMLAVFLDMVLRPGSPNMRSRTIAINFLLLTVFSTLIGLLIAVTWLDILDFLMPNLNSDTFSRLNGGDQGSGSERIMLAIMGYEYFLNNPLFGAGYAATRVWSLDISVHNMFVLVLVEFGIIGGLWYTYFLRCVFILPSRFGLILGVLLVCESFFTHSYFDLAYYVLLISIYWRISNLIAEQCTSSVKYSLSR